MYFGQGGEREFYPKSEIGRGDASSEVRMSRSEGPGMRESYRWPAKFSPVTLLVSFAAMEGDWGEYGSYEPGMLIELGPEVPEKGRSTYLVTRVDDKGVWGQLQGIR